MLVLEKDIYVLKQLFELNLQLYKKRVSKIFGKINKYIFSLDESSDISHKYTKILDDIMIYSDMQDGYAYSLIENKEINQKFNIYLDKFVFFDLDVIFSLKEILNEDEVSDISNYLIFFDFSKDIIKKYCSV